MKGTELVGYYKGIPQLCESMKKWDVWDLSKLKWYTYAKGNRMVTGFFWIPTLKTGKKAKVSETEVAVFQFSGGRCSRQDMMWGNWQNLDAISGAPPGTDNNPKIGYVQKMVTSWRTGKFHGSSCAPYFKNHFIPTMVIDARGPIKFAGISLLAVGANALCKWFAALESFQWSGRKDTFYSKGGQVVQAQTFVMAKGGKSIKDGNTAMFNFDANRVSYYDVFYYNPKAFDSLR